jgi:tetratricopeptide (TPR) repeat protein
VYGVIEFKKGNLQQALNIFKKVLHIDPNNTEALIWQMVMYCLAGRPKAAWPIIEKLLQIDPLPILSAVLPGQVEFNCGNFKESLHSYQKWLKIDPRGPFTRFMCSWNFALNNEIEESIKVLNAIIKETPTLLFAKFALFFKSALLGDRTNALKYATDELKQGAASIDYFPLNMAWCYALIYEKDEALWWLHKSLDFGYSPYPLMLKWETFQTVLKDHPGFQEYMQEIKKRSEKFVV